MIVSHAVQPVWFETATRLIITGVAIKGDVVPTNYLYGQGVTG